MAGVALIWRYRFYEALNYLKRRFDRLTYVEFVLATLFALFYSYRSIIDFVVQLQKRNDIMAAWNTYQVWNITIWVAVLLTALFNGRKKFSPVRLPLLLSQPVAIDSVAVATIIEMALPLSFLMPFWLMWHILFLLTFAAPWQIVSSIVWNLAYVTAMWAGGLAASFAWFHGRTYHISHVLKSVLLVAAMACLPVYFYPLRNLHELIPALVVAIIANISGWTLLYRQLLTGMQEYPQKLFRESSAKKQRSFLERVLRLYVLPAPARLRPLLTKDMLYAWRHRRSFTLTVLAALAGILYSTWAGDSAASIMEWHLAIVIGCLFLLSNMAFVLNDHEAENWALLKSVPLAKSRLWWSKFYNLLLAYLWLEAISLVVLVRFPSQAWLLWLRNLVFSLFIVTSLLFTQNNFSLYSYPYSKWAQVWYNLYVVTALAFFTVLLFPPLAILFLGYGYFAIFRVQRRFDDWEVTE